MREGGEREYAEGRVGNILLSEEDILVLFPQETATFYVTPIRAFSRPRGHLHLFIACRVVVVVESVDRSRHGSCVVMDKPFPFVFNYCIIILIPQSHL